MHLIDTGGPGGAETVFAELCSRLDIDKLSPIPVVPHDGWLARQLRERGFDPLVIASRGSVHIRYLAALARITRQCDVRLIHAHLLGSSIYAGMLGLAARIPVISVLHGPTDLRAPGRFAVAKRWLLRHGCSAVVAVSSSTRGALLDFGLAPEDITLIRNGVDTDRFTPGEEGNLRAELGIEPDNLIVGAIGNIRAPKAYDVLLKAARRVIERGMKVHFVVVGQGDDRALGPLLQLRASLGLEARFHFLGFRKSTSELYRSFDVFVSSSRSEGLSLSFLEAMATARPIVATCSGGAEEGIEPEVSGVLVPIEDPPALAAALERVLADCELRVRLGCAARKRAVESFSLDATVRQYGELYEKLLKGG